MEAVLNQLPAPPSAGLAIHRAPGEDPAITALRIAAELVAQRPTWVTFFREVLGVEGIVRKLYPTPAAYSAFCSTPAYDELQETLARLRAAEGRDDASGVECQRVITVRIPRSLHASLVHESRVNGTSMNQLCITRLLGLAPADA